LFGKKLDEDLLDRALEASQLKKDIENFGKGIDTVIGERGINISGGQKARISLARAIYSEADIYLLDDPLSAFDPQVAHNIFNDCIEGFLKDKMVVLVTH
jgi:ATP-binding cassette subfamily C (CFTR/MRP) protein 4